MLEMIDIGFEKAVAYRVEGKITEEEMTSVFSIFKGKIDKDEKLIVYQEVVSFGGVEFDAIVEKIKFFINFGISHFSKIAIVTHKKWIHRLVDLEGKLFKNIDIKGFPIEEKDKAVEFLRNANL
ncbi:MAG: STAS/SEC14 domain-containing protein [Deltaproteobacteria bacterium]|nr:STAS/SEC14 domain-containing protein [Deltaproteobacteria bacterium]